MVEDISTISFAASQVSLPGKTPYELQLEDAKYGVSSWRDVLKSVCVYIQENKPGQLKRRLMDSDFLWIDRRKTGMRSPFEITPGLWVELHGDAECLFGRASKLLLRCNVFIYNCKLRCRVQSLPRTTDSDSGECGGLLDRWNAESKGKIGQFVRLSLTYILQNHLLSISEFETLSTGIGTKKTLGIYLKKCPLISRKQFRDSAGFIRCWSEPIVVENDRIYANKEWYESSRKKYTGWVRKVISRTAAKRCNNPLLSEWEHRSKGKIGQFAFMGLSHILTNCLISREEFEELCTVSGVKRQIGISLTHSPLFGLREIVDENGYRRSWKETVTVAGRAIYMNQQWYESGRKHLIEWLNSILERNKRFDDMLGGENGQFPSGQEELPGLMCGEVTADEEDAFDKQLDAWGKESL